IALPDRTFYSLPSSTFRRLPLHLDRHRQLPNAQSSCGEWLVFQRQDGAYTLVSPFSAGTTMVLPRLPADPPVTREMPRSIRKLVVCSPTLVAAVTRTIPSDLLLCRPGSASWSPCRHERLHRCGIRDMVSYQGKLHALGMLLSISIA
uniref:KIB1-4 beta-propeller domain-containing protein n=2 Tax=Oryza brachyantha TaxID=4533 RepID=J3LG83_ORYBR